MTTTQRKVFYFFMLMSLCIFSACNAAPTPSTPDEVSLELAWVDTVEYSGFYMAQENGHYTEENIALDIKPYEIGVTNPLELVAAGEATFGLMGADKLLLARQQGQPVVAIATIYQRSPIAFISLKENNITGPEDLVGKKVMVTPQGTTDVVFPAMLDNLGIAVSDVEIVGRTDFSNDALLNGEVDVMDAFITNQPVQLEAAGYDLNFLLVSDYGIEMYANVIFTTEDMIASKPDVVLRFLRATLKGYEAAVANPEQSAELAVARNDTLSLELETQSMLASVPLISTRTNPPGLMTAAGWEITHQILVDQGILTAPLEVEKAYTLQFLETIYPD